MAARWFFSFLYLFLYSQVLWGNPSPSESPKTSAPMDGGQKQLLFDFRTEPFSGEKVPPDLQKKIFDKIFPKYLISDDGCPKEFLSKNLEQKRQAGLMVPGIVSEVKGSFTGTGLDQTAYLVWVNECDASHAEDFGSKRLVILSGDQVVLNAQTDAASILKTLDLNQDGINEFLLTRGWSGQGLILQYANVVQVQGAALKTLKDFKMVAVDSCLADHNKLVRASALYATVSGKGQSPQFSQESFQATCTKEGEKPVFKTYQGAIGGGFE
jgi:hypothetical protein